MKEKRYFCDWWDKNWKRNFLIVLAISVCIGFAWMFVFGTTKNFDYPEEMYKELETAYIPYVHEDVGVDWIGLKEAVHGLKDPIVYDDEMTLIYGYDTAAVTVILDENYKTISVERSTSNDGTYVGAVIRNNVGNYLIYTFVIFVILIVPVFIFIYTPSEFHKWLDGKLSKRHKKRKNKT